MFKMLVILCILLGFGFDVLTEWLDARQEKRPMKACVRDIYDEKEYSRWQQYSHEKKRLSLLSSGVSAAVLTVLFAINAFAWLSARLPRNEYANSLLLFCIWTAFSAVMGLPFHYINQMKIEEKYGFNRTTLKTFLMDEVKNTLVSLVLFGALLAASIACWHGLGNAFFLAVYGILALIMLGISTFSLTFMKLFNKFAPLEEGSLRTRLEALFRENGFQLKNIYVMNASQRTTKANAFCTGLGKFKEIALYDTLVNNFTEDEIIAVFAHELTHFRHGDTRHMTALNILGFLPAMLLVWLLAADPAPLRQLGFDQVNFGMIYITLFEAVLGPIMLLMQAPMAAFSRWQERRADAYPAAIGLAAPMESALKKLARQNFANLNPHPLNVKLLYDHPPIAERIERIRDGAQKTA